MGIQYRENKMFYIRDEKKGFLEGTESEFIWGWYVDIRKIGRHSGKYINGSTAIKQVADKRVIVDCKFLWSEIIGKKCHNIVITVRSPCQWTYRDHWQQHQFSTFGVYGHNVRNFWNLDFWIIFRVYR